MWSQAFFVPHARSMTGRPGDTFHAALTSSRLCFPSRLAIQVSQVPLQENCLQRCLCVAHSGSPDCRGDESFLLSLFSGLFLRAMLPSAACACLAWHLLIACDRCPSCAYASASLASGLIAPSTCSSDHSPRPYVWALLVGHSALLWCLMRSLSFSGSRVASCAVTYALERA